MSTNLIPVDQIDDDTVNLIVVYNCLNVQDQELTKLVHDPRKTLADYMSGLPDPEKWSVGINGELFDPSDWATVYPAKNDFITLMPIPFGGDKGKSVLRIAAMVAIAVYAPHMVPATWGATASAAAVAGINIAGAMIINALLPMPKPSTPGHGDTSESSTYGVDGAKNTNTEQTSVPLIYGEFRYAGNIVNIKTENQSDTQLVTAQMVVSEGQIESITDFEVQDQPIDNYEDVETVIRLGTSNQSVSSWFASSTRMMNKAATLTSTSFAQHKTSDKVDSFRIDLLFPGGLSEINEKDGKRLDRTVNFEIDYNLEGTSQWTSIAPKQYRPLAGATIPATADRLRVEYQQRITGTGTRDVTGNLFVRVGSGDWVLKQTKTHIVSLSTGSGFLSGAFVVPVDNMAAGTKSYKVEWTGASPTINASARYAINPAVTAKTGQPLRRSFQSPVLAEGVYNIRVRRTSLESTSDLVIDRVTLTDIAEITDERVRYNHTAFYGVRIRLSDQLSGMPRITAKVKGIKVKHYDYSGNVIKTEWSDNPAWITMDMLTNKRYGAGLPLSRIDVRMFVEWAEFCRVNKLKFNGVFDSITNIWDACQVALRVGHARFTSLGNVYSITIYRASEPVMMFGSGSIIEGTLQLSWQSLEDRANEFEVEYFDREDGNKPAIVRVVNEKALARGEPQRISTVRMVGIDNQEQALHEAHFQKALNENLIMTGQFEATVESLTCGVGDVVLIQHDMPDWGESGRIRPESTRTLINVDRPLEISASPNNMSFLILHPAVIRGTGVISNINTANKIIYLTGLSTSIRAKRVKVGSRDLLVMSMSAAGGYLEVVVESVSGLSVGNAVELWDTDVIETRKIQSYSASNNQLTLAGPLSVDPQDFANYMVGKSNLAAKPVSVTGISGTGEYKRTIKFIEYNATVFDPENALPTPIYSRPITAVQHVRDLRVLEEVTMRTGSLISDIVVSWLKPEDGNYAGAQVYMSRNGGPLLRHGTAAAGATVYHTTAVFGESLLFKVVAYDGAGRVADFDTAPIFEYNVNKSGDLPPVVQNFRATLGMDGIELMWDWIDDPNIVGYEIREGASWAVGKVLVNKLASNRFFSTDKNHSYIYWIKATDVKGKQSAAAAMATVTDLLKPAMPTSVDIEVTSFTIKLMPVGLSPGALWEFRRSNVPLSTGQILSNAVKVGQGTELVDAGLRHGTTYYYYIRGINAFAVGDWYPVQATTKTDIPEILDALAGQIRESHLWGQLNSRINLIDGPAALTGSVAQRIAQETQARINAMNAEATARANAIAKEASDRAAALAAEASARATSISAETAARASAISAEATARATEINNERVARQNALSAEATARAAAITKEQGDRATAINSERSQRISGDSALSGSIDTLTSVVNNNIADIATEKKARSDADGALASEINSIIAKIESMPNWVNGFEGLDYDAWSADSGHTIATMVSGAFAGSRSARISSSTSSAGVFEGVKVELPKSTGDAFVGQKVKVSAAARWNRSSGLSSREFAISYVTTNGTATTTSGWQRFQLSTNWETHSFHYTIPPSASGHSHYLVLWGDTSGANLQAFVDQLVIQLSDVDLSVVEGAILQERTVRVSAEEVLSERIDTVNSRVNASNAAINSEATTRANADTAITNTFNGAISTLNANVTAAINSEATTRASADSALTTSVNNVNARVDAANASISSEATARANADTALTNTFNSSLSSLNTDLRGVITSEASTRAANDTALANQINTVQSQMGDSLATAISEVETVVNGASIVKNGMFSTGSLAGWPGTWGQVGVRSKSEPDDAIAASSPAQNMAVFADRDHASHRYIYGTYFPVTEGDEYTVRVDYAASEGATVRFDVFVQWRNESAGTSTANSFLLIDASPEWKRTAPRTYKVPAGATQGRVYIRRRSGYAGTLYITNIINYRLDDAMSSKIDTVQTSLQGDVAGVQSNLNTQVSRVDGRVDAVSSTVVSLTTTVNKNAADIVSEASTRSSADSALSTQINSVLAKANANTASITSEAKSRADADTALATQINSVLVKANANSALITSESKARADADTALTTQINSVLSKANANTASIASEATTRANADGALSSTINAVSTKTDNNAAAIVTERNARTSADNALSSQINTVQATLGDAISSARVEAESAANGSTIVKNGMFGSGDLTGWPGSWSPISVVQKNDASTANAEKTMPTLNAASFPDQDHGALRYLYGEYFPVTAGDEYVFRADYAGGGSGISVNFRFYVHWRNDATATNTYSLFTTSVTSTAWERTDSFSFKVPAGTTRARVFIRRETGGNGRLFVTNIVGYRSDDAMSSLITTVQSSLNGNIAGVQTNLNTQVNRLDGRVDTVASSVTTVSTRATNNTAAISSEATTRANADTALAGQITTAQSTLNGQISSVQQSLSTSISNVDRRVDGMADTTNLVTNGSLFTGDTTGWTSVSSAISVTPAIDRGGKIVASNMMVFPNNETSYTPRSTSVPVREGEKFGVSFDYAHGGTGAGNRFRALVQWLNSDGGTISTQYGVIVNATMSWQRYGDHVFTAPVGAVAARFGINRLGSNPGTGYAANLMATRVDSVLGAQYTLKLDVNGFVSGFGAYNDGTTSDFGIIANRFYVAAPGSTSGAMPFLVSGNAVYINEALIQTLTIGKLRSSTGGVVVTGNKIRAEFIDADNLDVRSSARFSGDVQSASYSSAAKAGWRIRQNGTVEFNEGQFNGTLNVGSGTLGDNVTIAGVDNLGLIRQRAYEGSLSKTRTDQWTRPTSTLIDGNKIFTGDAYVDTLQIKGNAVTIPTISHSRGGYPIPDTLSGWETVSQVVLPQLTAGLFMVSAGFLWLHEYSFSSVGPGLVAAEVRLIDSEGEEYFGPVLFDKDTTNSNVQSGSNRYAAGSFSNSTQISRTRGGRILYLQVRRVAGNQFGGYSVRSRFISVLGAQR